MSGMHTNRHLEALSLCVKALSKGRYGSSLIGVDGCRNERLLDQGIQVPENISRATPDWVFPYGTGSRARHQNRPDAVEGLSASLRCVSMRPLTVGVVYLAVNCEDLWDDSSVKPFSKWKVDEGCQPIQGVWGHIQLTPRLIRGCIKHHVMRLERLRREGQQLRVQAVSNFLLQHNKKLSCFMSELMGWRKPATG
eukprot:1143456-Pelagomonas_calceolata.AAC.18